MAKESVQELTVKKLNVENHMLVGGTEISANASEVNILDGATVTTAEINKLDGAPFDATITVGAETGGNTINVAVQLKDANGADLAVRGAVPFYLSADANGDAIGTAPSGGIAIGTDGLMIEWTANVAGLLISEADGDIDINLIEAAGLTVYLILVLPNGKLKASAAITFAA